jgi:hypothetical protein
MAVSPNQSVEYVVSTRSDKPKDIQKSSYVPYEVVKDAQGNIIKEVKRGVYTKYSSGKWTRSGVYESEVKTYSNGKLIEVQSYSPVKGKGKHSYIKRTDLKRYDPNTGKLTFGKTKSYDSGEAGTDQRSVYASKTVTTKDGVTTTKSAETAPTSRVVRAAQRREIALEQKKSAAAASYVEQIRQKYASAGKTDVAESLDVYKKGIQKVGYSRAREAAYGFYSTKREVVKTAESRVNMQSGGTPSVIKPTQLQSTRTQLRPNNKPPQITSIGYETTSFEQPQVAIAQLKSPKRTLGVGGGYSIQKGGLISTQIGNGSALSFGTSQELETEKKNLIQKAQEERAIAEKTALYKDEKGLFAYKESDKPSVTISKGFTKEAVKWSIAGMFLAKATTSVAGTAVVTGSGLAASSLVIPVAAEVAVAKYTEPQFTKEKQAFTEGREKGGLKQGYIELVKEKGRSSNKYKKDYEEIKAFVQRNPEVAYRAAGEVPGGLIGFFGGVSAVSSETAYLLSKVPTVTETKTKLSDLGSGRYEVKAESKVKLGEDFSVTVKQAGKVKSLQTDLGETTISGNLKSATRVGKKTKAGSVEFETVETFEKVTTKSKTKTGDKTSFSLEESSTKEFPELSISEGKKYDLTKQQYEEGYKPFDLKPEADVYGTSLKPKKLSSVEGRLKTETYSKTTEVPKVEEISLKELGTKIKESKIVKSKKGSAEAIPRGEIGEVQLRPKSEFKSSFESKLKSEVETKALKSEVNKFASNIAKQAISSKPKTIPNVFTGLGSGVTKEVFSSKVKPLQAATPKPQFSSFGKVSDFSQPVSSGQFTFKASFGSEPKPVIGSDFYAPEGVEEQPIKPVDQGSFKIPKPNLTTTPVFGSPLPFFWPGGGDGTLAGGRGRARSRRKFRYVASVEAIVRNIRSPKAKTKKLFTGQEFRPIIGLEPKKKKKVVVKKKTTRKKKKR